MDRVILPQIERDYLAELVRIYGHRHVVGATHQVFWQLLMHPDSVPEQLLGW